MRSLTTHRQVATMPKTPITPKVHKALDVHRHVATQVTLNCDIGIYILADREYLCIGQVIHPPIFRYSHSIADLPCYVRANSVNVS